MNTKTMISVKVDKKLKEQATKIVSELGFSLSAVINANLKKIVREKKIEYKIDSECNSELVKSVLEAEKDYYEGKNILGSFSTMKEIKECLDK
jgi:addiction module RelB/DinJ family antitoxin